MIVQSIEDAWRTLEIQDSIYAITYNKPSILFMELDDEEDEAGVRVFLNIDAAKEYRTMIIEEGYVSPSSVSVCSMSLKDLFDLKEQLLDWAQKEFEMSLKIMISDIWDFEILFEDDLYNSKMMIN